MIHKLKDGTFVISSGGTWLSGIYDCETTATFALDFSDSDLNKLQEEKNKTTSVITMLDLAKIKKTML